MFATRNEETLHVKSWEYNMAQVMTKVAEIVEANGGRVKPWYTVHLINRSIEGEIIDKEYYLERLKNVATTMKKEIRLTKIEDEIAELKAIPNKPITVTHGTYIVFVLGDIYYSYSVDENPFFDFYLSKIKVIDGKRSRNVYATEAKKDWVKDEMFKRICPKEIIDNAAQQIYDELMDAPYSRPTRKRIPNFEKIDF